MDQFFGQKSRGNKTFRLRYGNPHDVDPYLESKRGAEDFYKKSRSVLDAIATTLIENAGHSHSVPNSFLTAKFPVKMAKETDMSWKAFKELVGLERGMRCKLVLFEGFGKTRVQSKSKGIIIDAGRFAGRKALIPGLGKNFTGYNLRYTRQSLHVELTVRKKKKYVQVGKKAKTYSGVLFVTSDWIARMANSTELPTRAGAVATISLLTQMCAHAHLLIVQAGYTNELQILETNDFHGEGTLDYLKGIRATRAKLLKLKGTHPMEYASLMGKLAAGNAGNTLFVHGPYTWPNEPGPIAPDRGAPTDNPNFATQENEDIPEENFEDTENAPAPENDIQTEATAADEEDFGQSIEQLVARMTPEQRQALDRAAEDLQKVEREERLRARKEDEPPSKRRNIPKPTPRKGGANGRGPSTRK